MASVITTAGATRMDQLAGNEEPLVIDRMVLALIPDLDTSVADPDQQMPNQAYIVHTYDIPDEFKGYVAPNQVVFSMILGTDVGNFSFNWIGMVEAGTNTVITVTVTPEASKWATNLATNTTGNNITRNVILSYQDAQNLTGISVAAETWQFDYQGEFNSHISAVVDPTQTGAVPKHLTNTQAKVWQDHIFRHANPDTSDATMKHVTDGDVRVWRDHVNKASIHVFAGMEVNLSYIPSAGEMTSLRLFERNGASLLRADYPALYGKIGTMYGAVDGTHFNLPDDRGLFLRIMDHGAGIDPDAAARLNRGDGTIGNNVGTLQPDGFKQHTHESICSHTAGGTQNRALATDGTNTELQTGANGGNETRPVNRYKWGGIFY